VKEARVPTDWSASYSICASGIGEGITALSAEAGTEET
jgi:hypothetical protein